MCGDVCGDVCMCVVTCVCMCVCVGVFGGSSRKWLMKLVLFSKILVLFN